MPSIGDTLPTVKHKVGSLPHFLLAAWNASHYSLGMDDRTKLIAEIDAYCSQAGISPKTLGRKAGQAGSFYVRLKAGKRSWPETIEKVRAYMQENPPDQRGAA